MVSSKLIRISTFGRPKANPMKEPIFGDERGPVLMAELPDNRVYILLVFPVSSHACSWSSVNVAWSC
jgi:hypothetical protein